MLDEWRGFSTYLPRQPEGFKGCPIKEFLVGHLKDKMRSNISSKFHWISQKWKLFSKGILLFYYTLLLSEHWCHSVISKSTTSNIILD